MSTWQRLSCQGCNLKNSCVYSPFILVTPKQIMYHRSAIRLWEEEEESEAEAGPALLTDGGARCGEALAGNAQSSMTQTQESRRHTHTFSAATIREL